MTNGVGARAGWGPESGLPGFIRHLLAPNPSPMTLDGTNTWVVDGVLAIDPGPADDEHLRAIGAIRYTTITHGHIDHVEGVPRLIELTGAERIAPERVAEVIEGASVVPSPGHTSDSVSFLVDRGGDRVIFTGDAILGRGSSVVMWPDGDVGAYLETLKYLSELEGVTVLPGHGPILPDCAAAANWLLQHRLERLDQVRDALRQGAETPEDVVRIVYADVDPGVRMAAEWTVRSQLAYLRGNP
ncbi:glyoxylase-like metal-dependent hydrolase (beta-lactamase superfamily II) [Hamadaea flava]|uniref:MBL fold metallo-hydrolase n=1 Tax=Hamadaea flava TaxID=1742688 RepID=A0ABV8LHE6_9ACTN|nr:MBL fold metallo-hydrolase [Hamadaea flava]MCP2326231.1 glyoxylase-like metal-dependent hydrolase (beta-lactamase superfamily II) [Hamadaea flava]